MFYISWMRASPWFNPIIRTNWKWLIRLAWGRRRVASKAVEGTKAYPDDLGATLNTWLSWIKTSVFRKEYRIVISGDPESGYGARYAKELQEKAAVLRAENLKADMALRLASLQQERLEARAIKDFERADAIRDEIEAAGFIVADESLKKASE